MNLFCRLFGHNFTKLDDNYKRIPSDYCAECCLTKKEVFSLEQNKSCKTIFYHKQITRLKNGQGKEIEMEEI